MDLDGEELRVLSFDCYGTLIDWEAGLRVALAEWIGRDGVRPSVLGGLLRSFGHHETRVQQESPDLVYPLVLVETLRRIGEECGRSVSDDDAAVFASSVGRWPAFGDSRESLRRLATRYRLVILSNVDRGSFALSNVRLGVDFDRIVTAQDVGSYKPAEESFRALLQAVESLGHDPSQLLHVAQSVYHDHVPAHRLGVRSVWIDRYSEAAEVAIEGRPAAATPDADLPEGVPGFPSLAALADALGV